MTSNECKKCDQNKNWILVMFLFKLRNSSSTVNSIKSSFNGGAAVQWVQAGSLFIWSMLLSPTRGLYYAVPTNPNQVLQATLQQLSRCSSGNNARHISTMYAKLAHLSSTQWLKITKKKSTFQTIYERILQNSIRISRLLLQFYFELISLAQKAIS